MMKKKWEILISSHPTQTPDEIVDYLLKERGITDKKAKEEFFNPDLTKVSIASVGIDKEQLKFTIERLEVALKKEELIIVYGDYDVDGITGTAILWETLIALGFKAMPYIPHRIDEGYGLSEKGIDNILFQYNEAKLIITVDNGIVAQRAVDYAKEKNLDVIITDHHLLNEEEDLPKALSIVHTTNLCGAGIAWLLTKELEKKFTRSTDSVSKEDEDVHLELAALATVADLVPLTHANRSIVYHGVKKLTQTKRFGLVELYTRAAIDASRIGTYEIGHVIGPRLNAAGRLESAMDSLRLLCTKDRRRARALSEQLDLTNSERQRIMKGSVEHAIKKINVREDNKKIIIIADESYEEGVVGLIASKLVEEFYKPAIVISKGGKISKGSVRSVSGFNIIEFLRSKPDLFINVGGHPMAAGFSLDTASLDTFQKTLEDYAEEKITEELLRRKLKIDIEISLNTISSELFSLLERFAPFGIGNPQPVFLSRHVLVREKRTMGKENQHVRFILQGGEVGKVFEAVAFSMGDRSQEISTEDYIDIAYTIDQNEWKGTTRLQLKIKDFAKS